MELDLVLAVGDPLLQLRRMVEQDLEPDPNGGGLPFCSL